MPQVGFQPTIPVFERAKTVHALNRAAIVISTTRNYEPTVYPAYGRIMCFIAANIIICIIRRARGDMKISRDQSD
jgi:hypothetical protein